ncbi:YopX family protein [Exiguobacterium sp. s183]|uniref:YopX family protein n=1 Tax=Exiguobacterium sp. s183 TaxID=2751262 RepID=UPI001BE8A699|nr:YopX family protein [Exiguobacterium sp. s183]
MREIKFRAWVPSKKILCDVLTFDFNEKTAQLPIETEVNAPYWWDVTSWSFKDIKLLQYTGLKDKNDVEIYEGDIVRCIHWFFDGNEVQEEFTASVGFKDGSCTLENINSRFYSDYTGEENGTGVCWIGSINYTEEDYEVIGNIHEHPHLLKGE